MSYVEWFDSAWLKKVSKYYFVFNFNIVLWIMFSFYEKSPYFAKVGKIKEEYEKIKCAYNANAEEEKKEDNEEIIRAYNFRLIITLILSFGLNSKFVHVN